MTVNAPINGDRPKADAMVTRTPGVVLSILTADCQPVLFADPRARVVGAAHAGWRGALDGVLEENHRSDGSLRRETLQHHRRDRPLDQPESL